MNNLRNSVQLIGHLGSNPTIKKLDNGATLATVNIATRESYKNAKEEWVEQTTWHRLVGWDKIANRMEKVFTKGREVVVQGKLTNRNYLDKDGLKRYVTEVRIVNFELVGGKVAAL
ncbi:MAG: single-stranded DNA-binding protein, partial [Bacteroidota bacterium]